MGHSSEQFIEEMEMYYISVEKEFYEKHYDILKPPSSTLKKVEVISDRFKDDEMHKSLLKAYLNSSLTLLRIYRS